MARWSTVLSGVFLALSMVLSLGKLLLLAATNGNNGDLSEADLWLAEIRLEQYRPLFRKKGMYYIFFFRRCTLYRVSMYPQCTQHMKRAIFAIGIEITIPQQKLQPHRV